MGVAFYKDHKPGTRNHQAYELCANTQEKREFKAAWAKAKFKHVLSENTYEKAFMMVDTTIGEYVAFGACVLALGGWSWSPAVEGAKRAFARCASMGGKWIYRDPRD